MSPMSISPPLETLTGLVEELKRAWRDGVAPDAVAAVREHPDLLLHGSLVVDLAYEEYCLREEFGSTPEAEEFCNRFPDHQTVLREVIRGHRLLAEHPEILESAARWPRVGDTFEQLPLVQELGRGAFARVYLARDLEAGERPVVLKLTQARSAEARTLGTISHPHIVPILWARPAGGLFAVCMPFVASATLRDAVERAFRAREASPATRAFLDATQTQESTRAHPAPALIEDRASYPDAVAAVAVRLAGAVEYLHNAGIVHGDLKPSNVLLSPGGYPYLIDFNLSATLEDSPLRCGGTLPYMAPERLRQMLGGSGEPELQTAADVYAFGVLLFESLTGRVPLEPGAGTDAKALAADLLRRLTAAGPPAANQSGVPRQLAALIAQCLDLNPHRRPSMGRVRFELERFLTRHKRRARALAAFAVVAAVLTTAAAWSLGGTTPVRESAPVAPAPAVDPPLPEEPFARGVGHLKSGHVSAALKDFADANRTHPDGPNSAYLAYCFSLSGQDRAAAELSAQAIQKHRFGEPWARNNYAHALLQSAPALDKLREAESEAAAALAADPNLRPARLNRAYARFRRTLAEPKVRAVDHDSLADVETVMRTPPYTADLYTKAAAMTVAFGGEKGEHFDRAVGYLEEAVKLGRSPKGFGTDPLLKPLRGRTDFQRLLGLPPGKPDANPVNPYLASPPLR